MQNLEIEDLSKNVRKTQDRTTSLSNATFTINIKSNDHDIEINCVQLKDSRSGHKKLYIQVELTNQPTRLKLIWSVVKLS